MKIKKELNKEDLVVRGFVVGNYMNGWSKMSSQRDIVLYAVIAIE